jgi:hypothetical protein
MSVLVMFWAAAGGANPAMITIARTDGRKDLNIFTTTSS